MQVEFPYTLTRFGQVEYGAVLFAQLASGPLVRAVKAFMADEDGNRSDHLVSIGPFGDDIPDRPVMYLPDAIRDGPILDVTRVWTQLIHSLMAKMWIMARKLRLSFSKRVASLRMSFMVQKKRSTMLRIL